MEDYILKNGKLMKRGLTTGSCACAGAKAGCITLLSGIKQEQVKITLPNLEIVELDVIETTLTENSVTCSVIKNAGDDPDVTNGGKISATVEKLEKGILIDGGKGVGRVTRKGLKIPIGKAAINPVPLSMIENEILKICEYYAYTGGVKVVISVEKGEELAKKTMNSRLGIEGGISILGTTGIVEPMSENALIDTIKTEMAMLSEINKNFILFTPGNYARSFSKKLGISLDNSVKISNFFGESLDYAVHKGFKEIKIIGHAGKMIKLAGSIMNTHSKIADCRMEILATHCIYCNLARKDILKILDSRTTDEANEILINLNKSREVWESIAKKIKFYLDERVNYKTKISFMIFSEKFGILVDFK